MKISQGTAIGSILAIALLSALVGYWLAQRGEHFRGSPADSDTAGRRALYWYDPMVPAQHFDKPGRSPFMDMQLVPRYADEGEDTDAGVRIDPSVEQNLGMRFATVERERTAASIEVPGTIAFDQRAMAIVQSRSAGFVSRVYARSPGDVIARNAALVDLLMPEWAAAQTEYLALLKSGDTVLIGAARERLRLMGMPSDVISRVERRQQVQSSFEISAPIAGTIETLDVREGMTVAAGATLAKIDGLDPIWIEAAVPEKQSDLTSIGKSAQMRIVAYPGELFEGRVIAVLPQANAETHTVRVRIELDNRDGRLKPGMFAQVRWDIDEPRSALRVPSEAVIHSGTRTLVILVTTDHHFQPVEVQIGSETGGRTSILSGLQEGQRVVISGQFLIDSEANLRGVLGRMNPAVQAPATSPPAGASQ